ncbi:MAG: hypothetical protein R2867_46640 [Caldilineaceae bacterium]
MTTLYPTSPSASTAPPSWRWSRWNCRPFRRRPYAGLWLVL